MAELMARLGDADLGNGERISFAAEAEGGDSRQIGLKREHDEVIDRAEIVARHRRRNVAIGPLAIGVGDGRQRRIEPRIGSSRANFRLSNRSEVLIEPSFIRRSHRLLDPAHFREVGVQNAPLAAQGSPLSRLATFRFFKQRSEDLAATAH